MCDPVSVVVGLGTAAVASKASKRPSGGDPEKERQRAEAEAAASANRQLAADQRRRREQQSLVARGGPQPSLGDEEAGFSEGLVNSGFRSRSQMRTSSLLASGDPRLASTSVASPSSRSYTGGSSGRVTDRRLAR